MTERTLQLPRVFQPTRIDWVVGGLLVGASAAIMFDAWQDIYRVATTDEECSYCLLAPIVIITLIWVRRDSLRKSAAGGGWVGIAVLLLGWLIYWYGYTADPVVWRAGAVIASAGALMSALGLNAIRRLAPALAAFAFLIPVDPNGRYHLAGPLQTITSQATQKICDLVSMDVDRSGNLLSINGVGVTIAEACNGMRMMLTLFLVCYVVSFTLPLRTHVRVLLLLASPLVAVIFNVIRLVPTVWMFGHRSIQSAERFHELSGWAMTFLAALTLMGFFRILQIGRVSPDRFLPPG